VNKNPNLKEQIVNAYKEIREIKKEEEALRTVGWSVILLIATLPITIQILIRPAFVGVINAVKCGQPTQHCLEILLHRED
jgi:hypothetical protein